jgi:hypothetical protein
MAAFDRLAQSLFPDFKTVLSPDFFRLLQDGDMNIVIVRYSDLEKLREHHSQFPLPYFTPYVVMDGHIGEYPIPRLEFVAITPFGMFDCDLKERKQPIACSIVKDTDCMACMFGVWPCEKHIKI